MDNRRLNAVLHQLHHLTGDSATSALTDGQLLGRFVSRRDEVAFELLVRRHGPLVWSACRRILGNAHDAEDTFQAVFLVLVRRATSLDRGGPQALAADPRAAARLARWGGRRLGAGNGGQGQGADAGRRHQAATRQGGFFQSMRHELPPPRGLLCSWRRG